MIHKACEVGAHAYKTHTAIVTTCFVAAAQCVAAAYGIGQNAPSAALEARTDVASLVEAALNKQQAAEAKKNEGVCF
jgi:hypothetical protein